MINYALSCDRNFSVHAPKHLVMSCLDQLTGDIQASKDGIINHYTATSALLPHLDGSFETIIESRSACSAGMKVRGEVVKR